MSKVLRDQLTLFSTSLEDCFILSKRVKDFNTKEPDLPLEIFNLMRECRYTQTALYEYSALGCRAAHHLCTESSLSENKVFFEDSKECLGSLKDLRDMNAHVDDYRRGNGKKKGFVKITRNFGSDATSTLILDGKILLGGRVDLEKYIKKVDELFNDWKDLKKEGPLKNILEANLEFPED